MLNVRLKNRLFSFPPRNGRKYLCPQTGARTVLRYKRAISREYRPRLFSKRKAKLFSPEIYPAVFRKPFVFPYTFGRVKRAVLTAEKALFCSGNETAPFADTASLFHVFHILDQIGGLTIQEGANHFKSSPRWHLSAPYLLEHCLAHNLFFAYAVCVIARLFQRGQHINFIHDWHW